MIDRPDPRSANKERVNRVAELLVSSTQMSVTVEERTNGNLSVTERWNIAIFTGSTLMAGVIATHFANMDNDLDQIIDDTVEHMRLAITNELIEQGLMKKKKKQKKKKKH